MMNFVEKCDSTAVVMWNILQYTGKKCKILQNKEEKEMSKEQMGTKLCKHCKTEIPAGAKICPNCRKKQGGGVLKWVIIVVLAIGIIGAATGGDDDKEKPSSSTKTNVSQKDTTKAPKETEEPTTEAIEYVQYSVDEMMEDLDKNAMVASDKYKDQYLEITGKLSTIDSSGKYISLVPADKPYAIIGAHCSIKNDEQKERVKELSSDDIVTLKGKCTDVGEVMGYYIDIIEIE